MSSNTEAERFIDLELTDEIKQLGIVVYFRKDNRTNNLFLKLNHVYKQKQIISPIYEGPKWRETVDVLVKKLKQSRVNNEHILLIEDVLNYNFEAVCGLSEDVREYDVNANENSKRKKKLRSENILEMGCYHYTNLLYFGTVKPHLFHWTKMGDQSMKLN
ncbi:MAG TPA: hypothetical protein VH796_18245 [Nitrososphaeraceae archaeon]|jgi:hypothetical protein